MLHDDVFDEDLQLPRRLGAVHVDGVLPITDNFPSPVGISRGVPLPPWELDVLQELPLDSDPQRTSSSVTRPPPLQSSQDALLVLLQMSARSSVLPVAGQDDVVDLDALVDEGSRGVTRDLTISVQTIAENTRKVPTIF